MSYILDALRKAEHERHLGQPPSLVASLPPVQSARQRLWLWLDAGLGLGFNATILAYFLLQPRLAPQPVTVAPAQPEPVAPTVASTSTTVAPVAQPSPTEPASAIPRKAPSSKPVPTEPSRPPVAAGRERRQESPPKLAPAPSVAIGPEPAPPLDTLPAGARRGLPALSLDIHAYSPDADKRFVVVNGRRYREGDQLGEGPVLETVTANGAILRQGAQRFRLSVRR